VAKGETLGAIAKHWLGDAKRYTDIAAANGISNPDRIEVGQVLKIPLA
ncbi:MAG: LysM peptidoglycan-binding domain-containing protein, partial [Myxococcales bacterium]|nr:LysM peptidoglycan-binding domain-containing protein [Myxococcales bacterium]